MGFIESYQLRIASKRSELELVPRLDVVKQLIRWCYDGPSVSSAMVQAVDKFSDPLCYVSLASLHDEVSRNPDSADLGYPLGRLIARMEEARDAVNTFRSLKQGLAWEQTVHHYVRSLQRFGKSIDSLEFLLEQFRNRIRKSDYCWAVVASTYLYFGQNQQAINWARDWKKRSDLTVGNYITLMIRTLIL